MKAVNVAVLGATGAVGKAMLAILEQRNFPVGKLFPLASSAGKKVLFRGQTLDTIAAAEFDFTQAHIGLFSAGGSVSAIYAPKAAAAGCLVVDNTSHFRYYDDVPLAVPEVNPQVITRNLLRGIIANPNCSTIQMLVALKPIYDAVGIRRINVATYQAVSGSGQAAIDELLQQSQAFLQHETIKPEVYPKPIAFNVLPQIDVFQENGYTKEEMKMHWETQKILSDKTIQVNATCVRVPVVNGHSVAVHIETRDKISVTQALALLRKAPGVTLLPPESNAYPTALTDADGRDNVFVGRVREDYSHPCGLNLWCVGDNLRKGAALNAVQIAEMLI